MQRTLELRLLLPGSPEPEPGLLMRDLLVRLMRAPAREERAHEARLRPRELRAHIHAFLDHTGHCARTRREHSLRVLLPRPDRPLRLRAFSEDEAEEHVEAADGEEEERGDEREVVDVVREDRRADEALEDP